MREDPPPDARCRDKFLVQSVAITPERDLGNVTAIVSRGLPACARICADDPIVAERGEDLKGLHRGEEDSCGFLAR